jgi:hypothetical protein
MTAPGVMRRDTTPGVRRTLGGNVRVLSPELVTTGD